jgi:hypothetical protein
MPVVKMVYEKHFGCKTGDQHKHWDPHNCCTICAADMRVWLDGK